MLAVAAPSPISPNSSSASPSSTIQRTPVSYFESMLPSPPGSHPSLAPLSPPSIDLEPSPSYSPLSSPSHSPKPPPSPPLAPSGERYQHHDYRDRVKERQQDAQKREKARERAIAAATPPEEKEDSETTSDRCKAPSTSTTATTQTDPGGLTSASQSSDSIALRSTLRLLMLQRDRARRDIVQLEEMREAALKEPLQFVEYIQLTKQHGRAARTSSNSSTDSLKESNNIFANKELPRPQEIYRCPPIEWSKYQVLGAPLDALHEKQRRRPSPTRPNVPVGVPPSMQTGGIIRVPAHGGLDYADTIAGDSGMMQGRMRLFDGIGCVGR